jgi:hypothetical protein
MARPRKSKPHLVAPMIAEGKTVREIAAVTHCGSSEIARIRREHGFPTREGKRAEVRALMESGLRPYMSAELVGVSSSVAYRLRAVSEGGNG